VKVAPIILGRILAGFILALAIPFGVCAQERWSATTATLAFKALVGAIFVCSVG
jgi:hypothetical protein